MKRVAITGSVYLQMIPGITEDVVIGIYRTIKNSDAIYSNQCFVYNQRIVRNIVITF